MFTKKTMQKKANNKSKNKQEKNIFHKKNFFHNIVYKPTHHLHKHGHKILHIAHHVHHHIGHIGELAIIASIFVFNSIFGSGFAANTGETLITDHKIIAENLIAAQKKGGPLNNENKIISMREMDGSVYNSFTPGYCTYGAARISPEFFPYTDSLTQQRTRGGNAKDRCENAQATGYSIGSSPRVGALIVYHKIGNSGLFGHVGKVMYYNPENKSMIIRDMNRIKKFIMTDRRENTDNENIKCYIYNKKINNEISILETQGTQGTNGNQILNNGISGTLITTNTNNPEIIKTIISSDSTNNLNSTKNNTKTTNTTINSGTTSINNQNLKHTENNITNTNKKEEIKTEKIELNFDKVSDLAKHFLSQRNIEAIFTNKNTFKVGDKIGLTLFIKDKITQKEFEGLLNIPFEFITSNNNIKTNYSKIQLIKNGEIEIIMEGEHVGETTLVIKFGGEKIGQIKLSIGE